MPATPSSPSADSAAPAARKPGRPRKVQAADGVAPAKPDAKAATKSPAKSPAQQALIKLGLVRDIDLALHLPLRYEDETRIIPLRNARDGEVAQIEATVVSSEIQLRPRRQLVVRVEDADGDQCELRFFSFYLARFFADGTLGVFQQAGFTPGFKFGRGF